MTWCDPASPDTRSRALNVILDVVRRYDIDGVHLDDYFYPYPVRQPAFPRWQKPRRSAAPTSMVLSATSTPSVKRQKSWVRVGISPFGIWRPGVPAGIEAGLDSYEQLAGDSRKWLKNGWVDYLAPQLYWRISPQKQSFPAAAHLVAPARQRARSGPASPPSASAAPTTAAPASKSPTRSTSPAKSARTGTATSTGAPRASSATTAASPPNSPAPTPSPPPSRRCRGSARKAPAAPGVSASVQGDGTTHPLAPRLATPRKSPSKPRSAAPGAP